MATCPMLDELVFLAPPAGYVKQVKMGKTKAKATAEAGVLALGFGGQGDPAGEASP